MTDRLRTALESPNVRAFLRAIRLGEGTSDANGYRRIVGGELFDSFADHPRRRVYIKRYDVWSTAAGAYQFIASTWDEMRAQYDLPDFSPLSQDLAAVGLLVRRKALDDVLAGRIEQAIEKCRLEWASLPGSPYGQRTESMTRVLAEYTAHGGLFEPAPDSLFRPDSEPPAPIERKDTMAPFVAAALPAILNAVPDLIRIFGDKNAPVAERNVKAAERVVDIAIQATGAANAQEAAERIEKDPAAAQAVREAVRTEWFELQDAGGGIPAAREFAQKNPEFVPIMRNVSYVALSFLFIANAIVIGMVVAATMGYAMPGWEQLLGIVIQADVGATTIALSFWLGSSLTKPRPEGSK